MKKWIKLGLLSSTLFLTACGGPSEEELARQATYEENVQKAPEWSKEQQAMIDESRGIVIAEEETEEEEVIEVRNSFSPGEGTVNQLASMTRDELLALDPIAHMEIFINGVIRDEYTVAAHTLYGAEKVQNFKKQFREGLLENVPQTNDKYSDFEETTYVDRIGHYTALKDGNVASHHVDVITNQLNRIFVKVEAGSNFGTRVTVNGQVYPIELPQQMDALNDAAFEFVGIEAQKYRNRMTEDELKKLNDYFVETFPHALVEAPISESASYTAELGGFSKQEDGTWAPAQMSQFAWNMIRLVYGIR